MSKDRKVISLAERRRGQKPSPKAEVRPAEASEERSPVPGRMVWLHCPTCKSLEYTEVEMSGGRVHNVCGTRVEEAPQSVDLRAEYTIADINLERLRLLEEIVSGQRQRFEEYKKRLSLAAGRSLEPYATTEENLQALPVAEMDALGLLVSDFFHNPARHFAANGAEDETAPDSSGRPDKGD